MVASVRGVERGTKIGPYTIDEPLGEGGFGAVFRAHDDDGGAAAIKIFKDIEAAASAQHLLVQQNEIEALVRLRHPSLVKLFSYGVLEGIGLYLVMELVVGETLDRYLAREGRLETIEALRIARRLAEALAHCHALNVLHLDLKPTNIVLTDPHEPTLKILDFGLATLAVSFQAEHARVTAGTVAYLAPECLAPGKLARPSPRMDLYAVGTILYELLAGRLPFHGRSVAEVVSEKTRGALIPLASVAPETPPAVIALVEELMAIDPARRFASAAQLSARLKQLYFETLHGVAAASPEAQDAPREGSIPGSDDVPFVGRARELERLERFVVDAVSGAPRPAVVIGDAGSGKSRIVAELLRTVEQSGLALIAYGRCRELSALVPYSALREALAQIALWIQRRSDERGTRVRRAVAAAIADDAGLFRELVPELVLAVGASATGVAIGPGGARWVADAIRRVLAAITDEIPVVLAIEDLHWADEATLGVLERIAASLGELPAMMLGTARSPRAQSTPSPQVSAPASAATAEPQTSLVSSTARPSSSRGGQPWLSWQGMERVDLGPLAPADNRALLASLTGHASDEVIDTLLRWVPLLAAGNPLFAIQVVRNLEMEGFLRRARGGALEVAAPGDIDYRAPASVSDVLRRSIESLSEEAARVLRVAALIGRQFQRDDLAALGLFEAGEVDRAIDEALHCYLCRDVREGERGATSFTHDAARELLEASIPEDERPEHHRRIARRIEQRGGDPGTLAHHLERAGEIERAAAAYLAAGIEADRLQDPIGASRRLRKALGLVETLAADPALASPPAALVELNVRAAHELARVDCLLGSTAEPLEILRRTAARLPEAPLATAALSSALSRVHYVRGEFADAVAHAKKALAAVGDDPALRPYQCLPANILGRALCAAGKIGAAIAPLRRGCELAEAAGEFIELCHSRGILCVALSQAGHFEEAERAGAEARSIAERLGDPARLLGTWFYEAVLGEARYDWELGVRSTTQLLAYAEEHELSGLYLYTGTMYAGRHQFHVGQLYRARVLLSNALNLGRVLGIGMGRGWAEAYLGDVHFVDGRLDEARTRYERAVELGAAATGDAYAAGLGRTGLMHVRALQREGGERAEPAEIQRLGDDAIATVRASGNRSLLVIALERYAEALDEVGAEDAARAVRDEHDALVTELGLESPSFWPRIPFESSSSASPRRYWLSWRAPVRMPAEDRGTTQPLASETIVDVEGDIGAITSAAPTVALVRPQLPIAIGARRVALLETLASVEDFVPRFPKKPAS